MPFTNVPTTSVFLPQSELDYFLWPCISGEKYPPTLTPGTGGTVAYSASSLFTCVTCSAGATSSESSASWPIIGTASPRTGTFTGITYSCQLYANFQQRDQQGYVISPFGALSFFLVWDSVSGLVWARLNSQNGATLGIYSWAAINQVWIPFSVTWTVAGTVSISFAGSTVYTASSSIPNAAATTLSTNFGTGAVARSVSIASPKVSYTQA